MTVKRSALRHRLGSERESRCALFGTFVFAQFLRGPGASACSPSPASPVETISSPGRFTIGLYHKGQGFSNTLLTQVSITTLKRPNITPKTWVTSASDRLVS